MSLFHPSLYQLSNSMFTVPPYWNSHWKSHGHFWPSVYSHTQGPGALFTQIIRRDQDTAEHFEYHHFYGPNREVFFSPIWYCQQPSVLPLPNVAPQQSHHEVLSEAWPEGFTLRGELRWGKLQRVFGANRELPGFVKEDLRRVYGTYPSTAVSISYQNREFLVRGNPRVGDQEYRVEKKLVWKGLPEGDQVSEEVKKKKKKKGKVV